MGFGYSTTTFGEIVFNTGMVGYTETLTDPSYSGQILTLTYPLVGNYGVPDPKIKDESGVPKYFESGKIQARGLVIHELSLTASHWTLSMTLDEWMNNEKIPFTCASSIGVSDTTRAAIMTPWLRSFVVSALVSIPEIPGIFSLYIHSSRVIDNVQ